MKRTALIVSALLLAGCDRTAPPGARNVEVVFSVAGGATRVTGSDGEAAVDDWALLLYRDGRADLMPVFPGIRDLHLQGVCTCMMLLKILIVFHQLLLNISGHRRVFLRLFMQFLI